MKRIALFIKRKKGNFTAIILIALLSYSCVSTQSLLVEIPRPAPKDLPSAIQSLTLITQANEEEFTDTHADSLQKRFYEAQFNLDTIIYDLQMVDTTLQVLGELLFESGRYDFVIPRNRFMKPPGESSFNQPLSWDSVKKMTREFNTDALLSLDHLKTRIKTSYDNESFFDPFKEGFYAAATATMQIQYEALFRVYDPVQEKIVLREFLRDTLYWEGADASTRNLFSNLSSVKQALTESGISIALDLSEKISVIWRPERRRYFTKGNDKMKKASQLVTRGDWQRAISLWKEIDENSGSKSLKSKALLNIALAYEMTGSLEEAISWALKSYNTMYRPLTYEYLQVLKRRKSELKNQSR